MRIKNKAQLEFLQKELAQQGTTAGAAKDKKQVLICTGGGCIASGAMDVVAAMKEELAQKGLENQVQLLQTGCLGPCAQGPVVVVYPEGVFYQNVKPEDVPEVVASHLIKGEHVTRLINVNTATGELTPLMKDLDYFKKQVKIVLANCGVVDPLKIEDYIALEGYQALAKVLTSMTPDDVINEIKKSGLRGRGGGGFPVGLKWAFAAKSPGDVKYVLCNADEGDPGAFMDRSVLEGDPHSVIEAMTIAAFSIGAHQGYIYVRAEYPLAIERLSIALEQARERGLLGADILGSGFDFDLEIRKGSGAFVCGEETALMTSIEGNRGEPRPRPPFPAVKGLWNVPSLLNNVETYANIPLILRKGADWYAAYGTPQSKGTKVFALAGAVKNTGLVEIPIGMPLGELVFEVGGGIPGNKPFKAAQLGGPSGGCIPTEHLGAAVDYETLIELGAIIGSGGLIVMDDDACMVDVARFFLEFCQEESCGKCAPCRIGTKRMLEILERICDGCGEEGDVERLIELGNTIKDTALCGLGQTAPNPVLSTIRYFRHEYDAHIRDKHCPAGVCAALVRAPCQNACPAGVDVPGFVSLIGEGRYAEAMRWHRERNPFASICARVCFHPCESKCRRADLDDPVAIRGVKRFMVDQDVMTEMPSVQINPANANRKVAIIGAGPAGLTCGFFLSRLGYKPDIFEAESLAGGMLTQTIPAYRLPREKLDEEIDLIKKMGSTIHLNKKLGRDFTLDDLRKQGYQAVFMGIGATQGGTLGIPGEDAEGITEALSFLKAHNLGQNPKVGKHVAVIGGGNAAIDAARTAFRLGAEDVTIVYRRRRNEMPAWDEEIEEALREGVRLETLVAPVEVVVKDGKVAGLVCQRMELGGYDRSGRRRPVPIKGEIFTIEVDQIVAAIGQWVETKGLFKDLGVEVNKDGTIKVDHATGKTSIDWLFAGGDATMGASSVVDAIACGEKAAVGIDTMLTGEDHAFWRVDIPVDTHFDPDAEPSKERRATGCMKPVSERGRNFDEVELSFAEKVAIAEARRCLRCDYREACN
ncbi:MAG: NADH-ubiquinone oxidoreductase-F iron-sulfur binding region domain-containing protein [Myxococcota bacterium]|jgi:NADH-quinone oxidoreductase subunit F